MIALYYYCCTRISWSWRAREHDHHHILHPSCTTLYSITIFARDCNDWQFSLFVSVLVHFACPSTSSPLVSRFATHPCIRSSRSDANHLTYLLAGNEYNSATGHPNQTHNGDNDHLSASPAGRYAQNFYPSYPQHSQPGSSMPSIHGMESMHSHASTLATASVKDEEDEEHKRALFGDVPESKRRKFILVDDNQRGTRVRVRVMLDQVKMDDMPDAHLRINAVYPRSYFARQMRSPPGSPRGRGSWDDEDDDSESGAAGKMLVPVSLMDGSEAKLPIPRMTKSRRNKEVALNELGYRMSWGQARTFNGMCHLASPQESTTSNHHRPNTLPATFTRRLPQQDAEHHDRRRKRGSNHCAAFRDAPWQAKVA